MKKSSLRALAAEKAGSSAQKAEDSAKALRTSGLRNFGYGGFGDAIYGSSHSQKVKRKRLLAHNERQRRKKR